MSNDDDDDLDLDDRADDYVETPSQASPDLAYASGESPGERTWPRSEGGRVDLRTWPAAAQIFLNRIAAVDLRDMLTKVIDVTSPTGGLLIEFRHEPTGVTMQISNDEGTSGKAS